MWLWATRNMPQRLALDRRRDYFLICGFSSIIGAYSDSERYLWTILPFCAPIALHQAEGVGKVT